MTPTEYCRTELNVPNDSRAVGAVRGALQHTARHLGLPSSEEDLLISSTEELLCSALDSLGPETGLFVVIQERADRIEIELRRPGGKAAAWPETKKLAGIDVVAQETGARDTSLKLVKFLQGGAKPAHMHN
ncbi:MAG TPA: hypothetical protein VNJ12_03040 [Candidatus Dormibacteraeota bacterium]|nr:hypothetical protein [Candidatus Dormibacteraeota bacterium]